jgi:hypothetical protein
VLAGLWAAGWGLVPPLLHPWLEHTATQALGTPVHIETLRFRPWSLSLDIEGLSLGATSREPLLSVQRLRVNAALSSAWHRAPVLDELRIEKPVLHLQHLGEGRHNLQQLVERLSTPAPSAAPDAPTRFAVYNLQLTGGEIHLADQVSGLKHKFTELEVQLPFASTLSAARDVRIQPRLSFLLDGSRFESGLETRLFHDSLETLAHIQFTGVDLAPYTPYLPADLPVRLRSAVLSADIQVGFTQAPQPQVTLSGQVDVHGLTLEDPGSRPLLALPHVGLKLRELRPLQRVARFDAVVIHSPELHLNAVQPVPSAGETQAPPSPPAWALVLDRLDVLDAALHWVDAQPHPGGPPPVPLTVSSLQLNARQLQLPLAPGLSLQASAIARADTPRATTTSPAQLRFQAQTDTHQAHVDLQVERLPLRWLEARWAAHFKPRLDGRLDLGASTEWPLQDALPTTLQLDLLRLSDLRLSEGTAQPLALDRLEWRNARFDLAQRQADLGLVHLVRPQLALGRDADGRPTWAGWLREAGETLQAPPQDPPQPPWRWRLAELGVERGRIEWADQATPNPTRLVAQNTRFSLKGLSSQDNEAAPVQLALDLGDGQRPPGSLDVRGQFQPGLNVSTDSSAAGPSIQAQVQARRLPAHALAAYAPGRLNMLLARADASFAGNLQWQNTPAGTRLRLQGDATVEDLHAQALPQREDLLRWKSLSLSGLDLDLQPPAAPRLALQSGALDEFFAQVVVQDDGRLNLHNLWTPPPPANPAAQAQGGAPGDAADIRIGPLSLVQGRVEFADRFIRPNYRASLTGLTGKVGAMGSRPAAGSPQPALADLVLQGQAEGSASLSVTGQLNPLAQPLALNIAGAVRNLELPPLSPYAVKYAGHGIESGRLSMDVNYRLDPDGRLNANNQLVLHQLRFGEPVPDAPASLPVRLATALLADRHGVIDLNLPISGSLNDPEFSIGPVVFKLLGSLVTKAVTAPFSLLAGLGTSDEEWPSHLVFPPGSARLAPEAQDRLAALAQALIDKPQLQLTVTGQVHPEAERLGWQQEWLQAQVAAHGLAEVYRRSDIPKPRHVLGLPREIAAADMETLLVTHHPVPADAMPQLAQARAQAIRHALLQRQVPPLQVTLAPGVVAPATPADTWVPRADMRLAPR